MCVHVLAKSLDSVTTGKFARTALTCCHQLVLRRNDQERLRRQRAKVVLVRHLGAVFGYVHARIGDLGVRIMLEYVD